MIRVLAGWCAVRLTRGWCGLTALGYCSRYRRTVGRAMRDARTKYAKEAPDAR